MTKNPFVIAIDGTAASGKGTLAKRLAAHLDFAMLDTGLLYRRVALTLVRNNIAFDNRDSAILAARKLDPATLDDPDLRSAQAGLGASVIGAIPEVRQALLNFQREFPVRCGKTGAILDGRDIGTVIFPDAAVKFFVDAEQSLRAGRRHRELLARGEEIPYETVLADMKTRDARDAGRPDAPMEPALDAILIDTSHLDPDQVMALALRHIKMPD